MYERKGYSIVDYLYFANIAGKNLFEQYAISYSVEQCTEALLNDYKAMNIRGVQSMYQQAILDADVVLPDGIALQIYYFFAKKKRLHNLNGTDFCLYFLSYAKERS